MTVSARPAALVGELRGLVIGQQVPVCFLRDDRPTTVSLTLAEAR